MRSAQTLGAISGVLTTEEKKAILRSMLEGVLSSASDEMYSEDHAMARFAAAIGSLAKINAAKDGTAIVVAQIEAMIAFEALGDFETKDLLANAFVKAAR
jgi:hypothetical protein